MKNDRYFKEIADESLRTMVAAARARFIFLSAAPIRLLVPTTPLPWESLESTLFRAAAGNGLSGIARLERALKIDVTATADASGYARLSEYIGSDAQSIERLVPTDADGGTVGLNGLVLDRRHVALSSRRLCGQCVAEQGYGYAYWSLSPLAVCAKHGVALIDRCPVCQARLGSSRPAYAVCRCGADWRQVEPRPAPEASRHFARVIEARFWGEGAPDSGSLGFPDSHLERLQLDELLDLGIFLGALHHDAKTVMLRKMSGPVSMGHALPRFERAGRALMDWPNRLYAALRGARAFFPASDTPRDVARSLDHVVYMAVNSLQGEGFRFVTQAIADFLGDPSEWNTGRVRHRLDTSERPKC